MSLLFSLFFSFLFFSFPRVELLCANSSQIVKHAENFYSQFSFFVTSTGYMDRSLGGQARFNGSISLTLLLFSVVCLVLFERFVLYFSSSVFFFLLYFASNR